MFNKSKKELFLTEVKTIYKEVSKKYISENMKGNKIDKVTNNKNKLSIESNNLKYNIKLDEKGKIKKFQVTDGTYCLSGKFDSLEKLSIDKITDGDCENTNKKVPKPIYCEFDGELIQGAEYVNGQYTYRYREDGDTPRISSLSVGSLKWKNMINDGWGVQLTDKNSSNSVSTELCTYINDKPVISMSQMFSHSNALNIDLSSFNTTTVIDMSYMFLNISTNTLDISNFDTSKVTNMRDMFSFSKPTNLNLSSFNTSNVTDMSGMFSGSKVLLLDLKNFETGNVTNMDCMFENSRATMIIVSSFDTSKVTSMRNMFFNLVLSSLDLSNFDTHNVNNMNYMFAHSKNIKTIYSSNKFDVSNTIEDNRMFLNCNSLVGENGTKYNSVNTGKQYARLDGGTSSPGYFSLRK